MTAFAVQSDATKVPLSPLPTQSAVSEPTSPKSPVPTCPEKPRLLPRNDLEDTEPIPELDLSDSGSAQTPDSTISAQSNRLPRKDLGDTELTQDVNLADSSSPGELTPDNSDDDLQISVDELAATPAPYQRYVPDKITKQASPLLTRHDRSFSLVGSPIGPLRSFKEELAACGGQFDDDDDNDEPCPKSPTTPIDNSGIASKSGQLEKPKKTIAGSIHTKPVSQSTTHIENSGIASKSDQLGKPKKAIAGSTPAEPLYKSPTTHIANSSTATVTNLQYPSTPKPVYSPKSPATTACFNGDPEAANETRQTFEGISIPDPRQESVSTWPVAFDDCLRSCIRFTAQQAGHVLGGIVMCFGLCGHRGD